MVLVMGAAAQSTWTPPESGATDPVVKPLPPIDTVVSSDGWTLSPATAIAGETFALQARNTRYTCATSYSHMAVTVQDSGISLSLTSTNDPAIRCAEPVLPLGPTFRMPALKAGAYRVTITDAPACVWTQPACKIAIRPESAGTLIVSGAADDRGFTFQPSTAKAEAAFELTLQSYDYSCATQYSHLEYQVVGDKLVLSYLPTENPAGICPAIYRPYGPTFQIKGLKAGVYQVQAAPGVACLYSPQPCEVAVKVIDVGRLTVGEVTAPSASGWYLNPDQIKAGKAAKVKLLNRQYGNCHTTFSDVKVVESKASIDVSFLIDTDSSHVCIQDVRPHGPEFELKALAAGRYPVRWLQNPCPANAICAAAPLWVVVDTLNVLPEPTALFLAPSKPDANTPFELHLRSEVLSCGVAFSQEQVLIQKDTIRLSFVPTLNMGLVCVQNYVLDEAFTVPALKEGLYSVVVDPKIDCAKDSTWSQSLLCQENYPDLVLGQVAVGSTLGIHSRPAAHKLQRAANQTPYWVLPQGGKSLWMITGRRLPIR
jgi:hypothetical protein